MAKNVRKKTNIKKICAWCNRMMKDGTEPVTHGICTPCGKRVLENFERWAVRSPSVTGAPTIPNGVPTLK